MAAVPSARYRRPSCQRSQLVQPRGSSIASSTWARKTSRWAGTRSHGGGWTTSRRPSAATRSRLGSASHQLDDVPRPGAGAAGEGVGERLPAPARQHVVAAVPAEERPAARLLEQGCVAEDVRRNSTPWRRRTRCATGPTKSSRSPTGRRSQSGSSRWRTTSCCQRDSSAVAWPSKASETGTGSGSPSRRATRAATAKTAEESRPPEKLTRHGGVASAGRITRSKAASGSTRSGAGSGTRRGPAAPVTRPDAISSRVGRSADGCSTAERRARRRDARPARESSRRRPSSAHGS